MNNNIDKKSDYVAILSFYSFIKIVNIELIQQRILFFAKKKYIKGTITIAQEGINGSISGQENNLRLLLNQIIQLLDLKVYNIHINYSIKDPFSRIKVKLKPEIIALKLKSPLNMVKYKGQYIEPKEWDNFLNQDNIMLIDTRNSYEINLGTFKNSINPKTSSFREIATWIEKNLTILKKKKVVMFCTGGIRCEKSTSYLKSLGHSEVFQLKGGILQYLKETANKTQKWVGECFVFDDRGAVSANLEPIPRFWVQKGNTAKNMSIINYRKQKQYQLSR